jgi:hypothetical protein
MNLPKTETASMDYRLIHFLDKQHTHTHKKKSVDHQFLLYLDFTK